MTLPDVIPFDALYRGDYNADLASSPFSALFAEQGILASLTDPANAVPIRIPGRNIMKIRQLIDVLDDSPLQVGDVELYLEVDVESSTRTVARLLASHSHPADHEVVDDTDAITLIEHTSVTGHMVADGMEPNGAPAINELHEADYFGILLEYPEGSRIAFRFDSREEAQKHIDATLAAMPPLPEERDARWVSPRVVEVSA